MTAEEQKSHMNFSVFKTSNPHSQSLAIPQWQNPFDIAVPKCCHKPSAVDCHFDQVSNVFAVVNNCNFTSLQLPSLENINEQHFLRNCRAIDRAARVQINEAD
jgi:hypothetical protein